MEPLQLVLEAVVAALKIIMAEQAVLVAVEVEV